MSLQTDAFRIVCGDVWFEVNQEDLGKKDDVSEVLAVFCKDGFQPQSILEVGCSNGWRLKRLQEQYKCDVCGLDPSAKAIGSGDPDYLHVGTADYIPFKSDAFNVLIYGYCFAFIDPNDYFTVLAEGNRVLSDGGLLFIHDRVAPRQIKRPYAELENKAGQTMNVWFYEMDFSRLWLAHPFYTKVAEMLNPDKYEAVTVFRKDIENAFVIGTSPKVRTRTFSYD